MKTSQVAKPRSASPSRKRRADYFVPNTATELPESVTIALDDIKKMIAVLTESRRHLVNEVMKRPMSLSELTVSLQRDRAAVTKDVKILERAGLVFTRREPNPGHGIKTIVRAAARRIEVTAVLGH